MCGIALKEVLEGRHLPPIERRQIGMEPHPLVRKATEFFSSFGVSRLQCFQFGLNACAFQNTGGEGIEEGINPAFQILLFPLESIAPVITVAPGSVDLVVEGPDKLTDKVGRH